MAADKKAPVDWTMWEVDAPDRPFVTAAELAGLLGYGSESSIANLVELGQLPEPLTRGGTSVWTREDVILYLLLMKCRARLRLVDPPKIAQKSPKVGKDAQISPEA